MTSTAQIITLIGVILSFIIGAAGLWIGLVNSRKAIFINSVTNSRIKYIQDIRNSVSEFCGLVFAYHGNGLRTGSTEAFEIQKRYDNLKYLIALHCNIEDEYFDRKIVKMIEEIRNIKDGSQITEVENKIKPLILIMQYLLKLEWEVVKCESQKGILSKKGKDKLYKKYINLYEKYLLNQQEE